MKRTAIKPGTLDPGESGFTLLEILVALMVLASATIVFSKTISSTVLQLTGTTRLDAATTLGKKMMAQAQSTFAEMDLEGTDVETGLAWRTLAEPMLNSKSAEQDLLKLIKIDIFKVGSTTPVFQIRSIIAPQVRP